MSFFSGLMLILPQRLQCAAPSDDLVETDRSLRKRIDRTADEWHALAVGTANVNDTPAFAQMPRGFLCRNEQPAHIDGDQLFEIFKRIAQWARRYRCPRCSPEYQWPRMSRWFWQPPAGRLRCRQRRP